MGKTTATLTGFTAVLMWAMLAMLSARSGTMPPFQLAAITFLIGGSLGLVSWAFRPGAAKSLRQPWQVWALGVLGLFGYHYVYFSAIRAAPAVEVITPMRRGNPGRGRLTEGSNSPSASSLALTLRCEEGQERAGAG